MTRAHAIGLAVSLFALPASAQELRGEIVQGNLLIGDAGPGARVRFDGRSIRVSLRGRFVIGLAPDDAGPTSLELETTAERVVRTLDVAAREYPVRTLHGVARELVDLGGPLARDQRSFEARWDEVVHRDSPEPFFERGFAWPVRGAITSPFGVHRVMHGTRVRHWGVDLVAAIGDPVHAPGDGVVVLDAESPIYGRTLVIDHGHGLTSALLHLSRTRARVGQRVRRGEVIASSGASGRVTGPHLDWRMQLFGVPLDPESAIAASR